MLCCTLSLCVALSPLAPAIPALHVQESQKLTDNWANGKPRVVREVVAAPGGGWINHGEYLKYFENGQLESRGRFKDGLRIGIWEDFHANGNRASKGLFARDRRQGKWFFWRGDGSENLQDSGEYRSLAVEYAGGALSYDGYLRDNARHGECRYFWPDGALQATGSFRNGMRDGEWVFYGLDGQPVRLILSGQYADDQHGAGIERERWKSIEADARTRPSASAIDRGSIPPWFFNVKGAEDARAAFDARIDTEPDVRRVIARGLLTLSLDQPQDLARAEAWCAALRGLSHLHTLGWPASQFDSMRNAEGVPICLGAPQDPVAVVRAWSALLALVGDDWSYWNLSLRMRCSAVAAPPDGSLGACCSLLSTPRLRSDEWHGIRGAGPTHAVFGLRLADPQARLKVRGAAATDSLNLALKWLAAHQAEDGGWDGDGFSSTCGHVAVGGPVCDGFGRPENDIGLTGLALLAFLGDGNTLSSGHYRSVVRKAVLYLLDRQDPKLGVFGKRIGKFMYCHAIATTAMAEALLFDPDPRLRESVQYASNFLAVARNPYSAWGYDYPPNGTSTPSVTAWTLMALYTAQESNLIRLDTEGFRGGLQLIEELTDPVTGRCGYNSIGSSSSRIREGEMANDHFPVDRGEALTALALTTRWIAGQRPSGSPTMLKSTELLRRKLPTWDPANYGIDLYYWFFATQAMSFLGAKSPEWAAWSKSLQKALVEGQRKDGDASGSWDPSSDAWGIVGGRIYSTALGALCLESPLRLDPTAFSAAKK